MWAGPSVKSETPWNRGLGNRVAWLSTLCTRPPSWAKAPARGLQLDALYSDLDARAHRWTREHQRCRRTTSTREPNAHTQPGAYGARRAQPEPARRPAASTQLGPPSAPALRRAPPARAPRPAPPTAGPRGPAHLVRRAVRGPQPRPVPRQPMGGGVAARAGQWGRGLVPRPRAGRRDKWQQLPALLRSHAMWRCSRPVPVALRRLSGR